MDFLPQINGLNNNSHFKNPNKKNVTSNKKESDIDTTMVEDHVNNDSKRIKSNLIDLQDFSAEAQDQINILQIASEALEDITGNLNKVRNLALDAIDHLDDYEISNELKTQLKNIDKIHQYQETFEKLKSSEDDNYNKIVDNFKDIAQITLKLAKIQDFEDDLNDNNRIKNILTDIKATIASISSTEDNLEEVKEDLSLSIKNLNVTLENMMSAHSRIRNIEIASKTVELTKHQILNAALKSINAQTADTTNTAEKLVN